MFIATENSKLLTHNPIGLQFTQILLGPMDKIGNAKIRVLARCTPYLVTSRTTYF